MKWRMQWKKEKERVEKEKVEKEKCEMEARVARRGEESKGSEQYVDLGDILNDLSEILSEEGEASKVMGEDVSWLVDASDHVSELEFEDDELFLSSVGTGCEIFTVEEDIENKNVKKKSKKKRAKCRGKFSSATRCLSSKTSQQTPSSSSLKSCPFTSRLKEEPKKAPQASSRPPQDWLANNLAGFILFPFNFFSICIFLKLLIQNPFLMPSFEPGMFDKKVKVDEK